MGWFKKNDKHSKRKEEQPVDRPVVWPNGWAVRTPKGLFLVVNGEARAVFSERCLQSWGVPVRNGTLESLSLMPQPEGILGFRPGTLIKDFSNGRIYLISGSKKYHVRTPDFMTTFNPEVIEVSSEEAGIHPDGVPLDAVE